MQHRATCARFSRSQEAPSRDSDPRARAGARHASLFQNRRQPPNASSLPPPCLLSTSSPLPLSSARSATQLSSAPSAAPGNRTAGKNGERNTRCRTRSLAQRPQSRPGSRGLPKLPDCPKPEVSARRPPGRCAGAVAVAGAAVRARHAVRQRLLPHCWRGVRAFPPLGARGDGAGAPVRRQRLLHSSCARNPRAPVRQGSGFVALIRGLFGTRVGGRRSLSCLY